MTPTVVPDAAELERRHATVGRIDVHVQNIFDLDDPREDHLLYRAANHLRFSTRASVVRSQLLFGSGDAFSARSLAETERILRSRRYLNDAWVVPVAYDEASNVVDVAVTVRDVWTLNPGVSLGRSGGRNRSKVQIEESNLFGRGSKITLSRSRDVDRISTELSYAEPSVRGSWWQLGLEYADNSDGRVRSLSIVRPFYALDTRYAVGATGYDGASRVARYSSGQIADQFNERHRLDQAYYGWSDGLIEGVTRRWFAGLRYDQAQFTPAPGVAPPTTLPADRQLAYPWVGWQLTEDRYQKSENVDLIGRTEDLYLGRTLYAELGYSNTAFGGRGRSFIANLNALNGWQVGERQQLFVSAALGARVDEGVASNVQLTAAARYFAYLSHSRVFYASLAGAATRRLDGDQQLLLGGDSGLRGYPIRFQGGSSSALLTLEERVFTPWFPLRLVRVGAAVFFDAGRTWGRDYLGAQPLGLLKDVGIGLRLGNNRSGLGNVLHIDLSYALDAPPGIKRLQISFETKDRF